jgi:glyoxylase-like metal-dependent hydrolase (beta-lactamase superfamily II)
VTDVVFSHLHFDHIGWASEDGKAVFPNATYRCDQRDWDYWIERPIEAFGATPSRMATMPRDTLLPISGRFEMWSADGPLLPGLDVLHTPGHTPGSATHVVSSGTARALLLGDVVHCAVELLEDEWGGLGDVDPELAKRTRNALARELAGTDTPIAAAHFPGLQFGRLLAGEGKRRWVF